MEINTDSYQTLFPVLFAATNTVPPLRPQHFIHFYVLPIEQGCVLWYFVIFTQGVQKVTRTVLCLHALLIKVFLSLLPTAQAYAYTEERRRYCEGVVSPFIM